MIFFFFLLSGIFLQIKFASKCGKLEKDALLGRQKRAFESRSERSIFYKRFKLIYGICIYECQCIMSVKFDKVSRNIFAVFTLNHIEDGFHRSQIVCRNFLKRELNN